MINYSLKTSQDDDVQSQKVQKSRKVEADLKAEVPQLITIEETQTKLEDHKPEEEVKPLPSKSQSKKMKKAIK